MKMLKQIPILLLALVMFGGCHSNWGAMNKSLTFTAEVMKSLESSAGKPFKLSEVQREELFQALHGPARSTFFSKGVRPEVWASVGGTDIVTFTRYFENKSGFVMVEYFTDGNFWGVGRGAAGEVPQAK